jgi:hypothetical protein
MQAVGAGGLGPRRTGHRFVLVVYGVDAPSDQRWPGYVVHLSGALGQGEDAVRIGFEDLDQLPDVIRRALAPSVQAVSP